MQIFIARDSQQQGPFTVEEINDKIHSGQVTGFGTFAWYEGCSGWIALDKVPGVFVLNTPPRFVAGMSSMPSMQSDATGGLIPYKNPMALTGYYLSVVGLIPLFGIPIAIAAIIFGVVGLRRRARNPIIRGMAHALVAIILGSLSLVAQIVTGIVLLLRL